MPPDIHDATLPITPAAIVGTWMNDTPWKFHTSPGTVFHQTSYLTFAADGGASLRCEGVVVQDGQAWDATSNHHAGTWTINDEGLVVLWPTKSEARSVLTLILRRVSNGDTRVCLKKGNGAVWWRSAPTASPSNAVERPSG